jgi:hypothetical protein
MRRAHKHGILYTVPFVYIRKARREHHRKYVVSSSGASRIANRRCKLKDGVYTVFTWCLHCYKERRCYHYSEGTAHGWSFLLDPRNKLDLSGQDRWLLNRVRDIRQLRKRFLPNEKSPIWCMQAAEAYISMTNAFLEQLLLLIHITSGQPARGTELLTVQWRNGSHGLRRNIFIENGLVSLVTAYHKGLQYLGINKNHPSLPTTRGWRATGILCMAGRTIHRAA